MSLKFISENKDKNEAAIASELAAKIYNLEKLKSSVEDETGNITRFLMITRKYHQIYLKLNTQNITRKDM